MLQSVDSASKRREEILAAAVLVFGRFGFKKSSVEDIAKAARISKQGLYLHFSSKEEIFLAAMDKYLDDGLHLVQQALDRPDANLFCRLKAAMDAWFGRHFETFSLPSLDVIQVGDRLSGSCVEGYKAAFQRKLAKALNDSPEFDLDSNACSAKEIAQVLYYFGLTWKEGHATRADFMKKVGLCIRACCQYKE